MRNVLETAEVIVGVPILIGVLLADIVVSLFKPRAA